MQKVTVAVTIIVQMTATIGTSIPTVKGTPKEMSHYLVISTAM